MFATHQSSLYYCWLLLHVLIPAFADDCTLASCKTVFVRSVARIAATSC